MNIALSTLLLALVVVSDVRQAQTAAMFEVHEVPGQAPLGSVEIHGFAAGPFRSSLWQNHQLHR
jgi:hypothetical protein